MFFQLRLLLKSLLAGCVLLAGTAAFAHHGITSKFDPARQQHMQGIVSRIDWANPHVHLFLLVNEAGGELPWYVELESPQLLELNGWSEQSLKVGEAVEVTGLRARDGSRQLWGESIKQVGKHDAVLTTTRYPTLLSSIRDTPVQPTPRWPDHTPMFSAPAGHSGYWVPTRTTLFEDGVRVAMAANGQLNNIADAAKVAPLQPWALALYQFRQRNYLRSDPTYLLCRPPAGPRNFLNPYGIQLLEDKTLQRVFVIAGDGNNDWYLIYTDGRALDSEAYQLDVGNLLYNGRNTAHWEGDTFVVEVEGYNERFWLPGGLPHSEHMHVTEKLTRTDYNTLKLELTINDPATYTRPWKSSWSLKWLEGQDPPEHYCQDNRL